MAVWLLKIVGCFANRNWGLDEIGVGGGVVGLCDGTGSDDIGGGGRRGCLCDGTGSFVVCLFMF